MSGPLSSSDTHRSKRRGAREREWRSTTSGTVRLPDLTRARATIRMATPVDLVLEQSRLTFAARCASLPFTLVVRLRGVRSHERDDRAEHRDAGDQDHRERDVRDLVRPR